MQSLAKKFDKDTIIEITNRTVKLVNGGWHRVYSVGRFTTAGAWCNIKAFINRDEAEAFCKQQREKLCAHQ
jgi:hypothetical protein